MGSKTGNFEQVTQQVLRALRGRRSQRAQARRLGYRANPITDWEHGRRFPSATELLRVAQLSGVDVAAAFARFHPAPLALGKDGYDVAAWLDAIRGTARGSEVARRGGFSRAAVGRWLRGDSEPRAHDFFRYVDVTTSRLYALVAELVDIEQVPALLPQHLGAMAIREAATKAPWTEAVLRALETPRYRALPRHRPGVLAEILGIAPEQETRALAVLRRTGAVRRRRGLYACVNEGAVDMRGDPERVRSQLRHWSSVASDRLQQGDPADLSAYSISSLSEADAVRCREILQRAFREIRALVKASAPTERVMLINLQLSLLDRDAGAEP